MKPTDLSVYDFNEEDEMVENCSNPWSKFSNPKFHNVDARIKYDFLQHASSGSITQMKESHSLKQIHVVPIDDDDCGLVNDDSGSFRNASIEVAVKQAEVFGAVSDRILQQSCHFDGDSVSHGSSLLEVELKLSNSNGHSPGNDHMTHFSPTFPESPYINGSVDAGPSVGSDSNQDNSPSTSGSVQEETAFPFEELSQNVLYSGLDMEKMDTTLPADYVYFGKKYFPSCLIIFSETSLKIEMETEASKLEWNIEDIVSIASHWFMRASTAKVKVHILTKDAVPEENQQECVAELEFLVHDPHWLQRQESIISLDQRYRAIWRTGMNFVCSGELCEEGSLDSESSQPYIPRFKEPFGELVYPKGDTDAVSISRTDVELLKPDTFLNDTIIDFYLKYLRNGIPPSDRGRFHFFNSFFFTKLADPNKNASGDFDGKAGFQRVRKWTRKVNLFEKDYIFIPVNYNLHWSLIVICHPGEVAKFNEENLDHSVKVPCVLHMDSIRGNHTGLKDLVQRYLLEEWKEKHKEISEDTVSKFLNLRFLSLELPQQENLSDCGLFLLHYAELFISEAPENFSPFQINKLDNFLKPDWFIPAEASRKRVHIQRLIYDLLEDCPLENTSSSSHESQPPILLRPHENDNSREAPSGMDIGLLDISMCSNVSCLGMRDLECQYYDHGASSGQPLCPAPPIREEVGVDHSTPSAFGQSELQSIDEVASVGCHLDYTPRVNHSFQWNSEYSDQGFHPDNNSPLSSNHSSEDSEDVMIMEHEPEVECLNHGENRTSDMHKENIDSLTESYVSASSDVMETPPEDSQELSNSHENPSTPNLESKEMPAYQEIENDEVIASVNEVVEDSCSDSDEDHAAKRIRLMPSSDEERRCMNSLSEEVQV